MRDIKRLWPRAIALLAASFDSNSPSVLTGLIALYYRILGVRLDRIRKSGSLPFPVLDSSEVPRPTTSLISVSLVLLSMHVA